MDIATVSVRAAADGDTPAVAAIDAGMADRVATLGTRRSSPCPLLGDLRSHRPTKGT